MTNGVLYKATSSVWSKSQSKKMNGSVVSDGKVRHANAATWFDNYPMEQLYEQYFNVVWTHAYNGSGVKLSEATWGDHPRAGDTIGFVGLWGFDKDAMVAFVGAGVVQKIEIEVMFDDPGHAGNPVCEFYPHTYTSKPASYTTGMGNRNHIATSQFVQTGADYSRWITLPVGAWLNKTMGGFMVSAAATAANSARFGGKTTAVGMNAFNSRIKITVLK